MSAIPSMPAALVRTMSDGLSAVRVLRRSGAIELQNPVELLRTAKDATVLGPVVTAFAHAARHNGAATAIVDERGPLTFEELDRRSNAVANGLAARGITSGTVLAALCRDHRGMVLSLLAAGKLGARIVLLNTGMAGPQLVSVAEREGVGAILLDAEFLDRLGNLPDKLSIILTSDDGWASHGQLTLDDVRAGQSTRPPASPAQPGGIVVLTSGTTGTPKGAPRGKVSPLQSAQFLDRIPLPRASTTVLAAPAFHGTGLSQLILGWALGSTIVLRQRKFDPRRTLADIEHHRAGTLVLVPTMLQRIVDLGESVLAEYDTSSLKVIFAAGSSISPDLSRRTALAFGEVLYNLYASTEVAVAAVATPDDMREAPGTVGRPPVGCRVAIYDDARRRVTEPGVVGTIFVASALSFGGYTDGTGKEIVDGMQSSGDVGHFDAAGRLFIDGRDDDMIISGGENVFPLEVENLLVERPDVLEAAVVGVDDRDFGKRLRAFVVPAPGASCDAQQIKDHVKAALARHKVPRDVVFVDELPRNATGKLLRRKLENADPW
ncbi:acyl-CoA synthetase [Nocardia salmonicida]|uniref:acyl-CoA synthetase n=1 Tax=Nocardia salmonicida TaxID=53431 RepID=UPI002E2837D8|nr:acyl-CoA synthetase [Nocardia salmonicida]